MSVAQAIKDAGIEAIHTHVLTAEGIKQAYDLVNKKAQNNHFDKYTQIQLEQVNTSLETRQLIQDAERVKIICGVREPLKLKISTTFEPFEDHYPHWIKESADDYSSFVARVIHDLNERIIVDTHSRYNPVFSWFDKELKAITGFDVFENSFDKPAGYTIYKHGKFDILVYRQEGFQLFIEQALSHFLKVDNIKLPRVNISTNKASGKVHFSVTEQARFDEKNLTEFFDDPRLRHFYTDEEIRLLVQRWKR